MTLFTRIKYLLFFIVILMKGEVFGQYDEKLRTHSARAGYSIIRIQDDYITPGQSEINSLDIEYEHSVFFNNRMKRLAVAWYRGISGASGYNELSLRYDQAYSLIKDRKSRLHLYTGYSLASNPVYFKSGEGIGKKYSWATNTALSFYSSNSYRWKKHSLTLDFLLPVAGCGSRPAAGETYDDGVNAVLYNSFDKVFFTSWHNLQAVQLEIEYSLLLNRNWNCSVRYHYQYKRFSEGYDFGQQSNGLRLGISYSLD